MNISDAARELLPCPFCGGPAEEEEGIAFCENHEVNVEIAVETWNTRDTTATAALTLELETVRQQLAEAREDSQRLDAHAIRLASILQRFAEELPTHEWDFVLSTFDSPIDAALNPPTDEK